MFTRKYFEAMNVFWETETMTKPKKMALIEQNAEAPQKNWL